jgi:hypothetical protein
MQAHQHSLNGLFNDILRTRDFFFVLSNCLCNVLTVEVSLGVGEGYQKI